jgi:hypothetical protein
VGRGQFLKRREERRKRTKGEKNDWDPKFEF